ncbi:hypothetical protein ACFW1A_13285 [Kitasatospora sp. NPDC058965]|uniref:hypothetical protein n=1 Tax=Kitasatospora sp. NPDC058965 TaxID=3346682 RepID=UPI0036BC6E0A
MDSIELRAALEPESGRTVLSAGVLGPLADELLGPGPTGRRLVVDHAELDPPDPQGSIRLTGRCTLLQVEDLVVRLTAEPGAHGGLRLLVRFALPADWTFGTSFPELPQTPDWNPANPSPTSVPVDQLDLGNAEFVFATEAGPLPGRPGVQLVAGLNTVADLRVGALLGEAAGLLGLRQQLTTPLFGRVRLAGAAEPAPLAPGQWPWQQQAEPPPGLSLRADLAQASAVRGADFTGIALRVHSPLTQEWLARNPTYRPVVAFTGGFSLGADGVAGEAVAPVATGGWSLPLLASFRNARLADLTGLAPLLGKQDPRALLPDTLRSALKHIELERVCVELSAGPGHEGISRLSATVGLPELDWQVVTDLLRVTALHLTFEAVPALRLELAGQVEIAGLPLQVLATGDNGLTLYGRTAPGSPLNLSALLARYAPGIAAPADGLSVDALAVELAPGSHYALALSTAAANPWHLALGPTGLTVHDLSLRLTKPHDGPATGAIAGTVELDGVGSLAFACDRPGPLRLRGEVPQARLSRLVAALLGRAVTLPEAFDLDFRDSSVLIHADDQYARFQLATTVAGLGSLALEVRRTAAAGEFAAGIALGEADLTQLHGVGGVIAEFRNTLGLRNLLLVYSTFDAPDFRFPALADFEAPGLAGTLPPLTQQLDAGLTAYGTWQLNPDDERQALLAEVVGGPAAFEVALHLGTDQYLRAAFRSTVCRQQIAGEFGARLHHGSLSLYLKGTVELLIQGHAQKLRAELRFLPSGALLTGSMTGTTAVSFAGFQLANLAVAIGVAVDGAPTLGVSATVAAPGLSSSVSVLIDTTATTPGGSLVVGSLGDLTLHQVAESIVGTPLSAEAAAVLGRMAIRGTGRFTIPGALAAALDALEVDPLKAALLRGGVPFDGPGEPLLIIVEPGSHWQLTVPTGDGPRHYGLHRDNSNADITVSLDAQLYVAPEAVTFGGVVYPRGYRVSGELELFGLRSRSDVSVDPNLGLSLESSMDRLVVGGEQVLVLEGDVPGSGPSLSVATTERPGQQRSDAHATISGRLRLFGMERSLHAEVTADSLVFAVRHEPIQGVMLQLDLDCRLRDRTDLAVAGTLGLAVGTLDLGPLGRFRVDGGVQGRLAVQVRDGNVEAVVSGTLTVATSTVAWSRALSPVDLSPQRLAATVREAVTDRVRIALGTVQAWMDAVSNGLIAGVKDYADVIIEWFGVRTADEAASYLAQVPELGPLAVLGLLTDARFTPLARSEAMTEVYRWGAAVADAADLVVTDAALQIGDLFGIERGTVKLVLLNRTARLLTVTGVRGDEIQRGPDTVVLPGAAGLVGVFRDASNRWEWVYLQDQTTGEEYQLSIERTRTGSQYAYFGYHDNGAGAGNLNPSRFAAGVEVTIWNHNRPTATYELRKPPLPRTTAPVLDHDRVAALPGVLRVGQYLLPGESVSSPSKRYALRYGPDNLLVQLDGSGTVVWRSPGEPGHPGICVLQRDGNLVIYDRYNKPTWWTATRGDSNVLHVGDAGGVELHSGSGTRLWANHA